MQGGSCNGGARKTAELGEAKQMGKTQPSDKDQVQEMWK